MRDKKGLVLCVDDEPSILRSLHWLLHKDFNVMTAPNGMSGLEMLRKHDFDVVVSDQRMPGMIGSEFLREACKTSPRAMRILLTGYSDLQAILRSVNEGEVFRFVNKPWLNDELTKTVEEAAVIAQSHPVSAAVPAVEPTSAGVLLIDDSEDMVRMLQEAAEPGSAFRHTTNMAEAVQIINAQRIGVIICDTHVGGVDTTPLVKLLKQERPEIVSIVLTGDSDVDTIIKLINQGQIYRFLPKPVKPGFMKIMLASAVNKHHELMADPERTRRHAVDRMASGVEEKLMEDLQQQARAMPEGAMTIEGEMTDGSLFGRLSKGFRRMFH